MGWLSRDDEENERATVSGWGGVRTPVTGRDLDALSRISYAEAAPINSPNKYGSVVDSINNRAAANLGRWGGKTLQGVINKPTQYSPVNDLGSWSKLPGAPTNVQTEVARHIAEREMGYPSTVGKSTHYLNPAVSHTAPAKKGWAKDWRGWQQIGTAPVSHFFGAPDRVNVPDNTFSLAPDAQAALGSMYSGAPLSGGLPSSLTPDNSFSFSAPDDARAVPTGPASISAGLMPGSVAGLGPTPGSFNSAFSTPGLSMASVSPRSLGGPVAGVPGVSEADLAENSGHPSLGLQNALSEVSYSPTASQRVASAWGAMSPGFSPTTPTPSVNFDAAPPSAMLSGASLAANPMAHAVGGIPSSATAFGPMASPGFSPTDPLGAPSIAGFSPGQFGPSSAVSAVSMTPQSMASPRSISTVSVPGLSPAEQAELGLSTPTVNDRISAAHDMAPAPNAFGSLHEAMAAPSSVASAPISAPNPTDIRGRIDAAFNAAPGPNPNSPMGMAYGDLQGLNPSAPATPSAVAQAPNMAAPSLSADLSWGGMPSSATAFGMPSSLPGSFSPVSVTAAAPTAPNSFSTAMSPAAMTQAMSPATSAPAPTVASLTPEETMAPPATPTTVAAPTAPSAPAPSVASVAAPISAPTVAAPSVAPAAPTVTAPSTTPAAATAPVSPTAATVAPAVSPPQSASFNPNYGVPGLAGNWKDALSGQPAPPDGFQYGYSPLGRGVSLVGVNAPEHVKMAATGPGIFGAIGPTDPANLGPAPFGYSSWSDFNEKHNISQPSVLGSINQSIKDAFSPLTGALNSINQGIASTVSASPLGQMSTALNNQIGSINQNIKDAVSPVTGAINAANKAITGALNPHADGLLNGFGQAPGQATVAAAPNDVAKTQAEAQARGPQPGNIGIGSTATVGAAPGSLGLGSMAGTSQAAAKAVGDKAAQAAADAAKAGAASTKGGAGGSTGSAKAGGGTGSGKGGAGKSSGGGASSSGKGSKSGGPSGANRGGGGERQGGYGGR